MGAVPCARFRCRKAANRRYARTNRYSSSHSSSHTSSFSSSSSSSSRHHHLSYRRRSRRAGKPCLRPDTRLGRLARGQAASLPDAAGLLPRPGRGGRVRGRLRATKRKQGDRNPRPPHPARGARAASRFTRAPARQNRHVWALSRAGGLTRAHTAVSPRTGDRLGYMLAGRAVAVGLEVAVRAVAVRGPYDGRVASPNSRRPPAPNAILTTVTTYPPPK